MIKGSCHCGAVTYEVDCLPEDFTDCNCSICRRYGAWWAYYSPKQVRFSPAVPVTDVYIWGDKMLEFHRCRACGCVTHWVSVDKTRDRMGVNARMMDLAVTKAVRVRRLDGADTWEFLD